MSDIRYDLLGLIVLNELERWVPHHIALQQLEYLGNELVPGLIECLTDDDAKVRQLAVELVCEVRPRPASAVPSLIERLNDEDRLVRVAVANNIADFGQIAVGAIPHLEEWIELDDDDYVRVLALTAIVKLDPQRQDLLPLIYQAVYSCNPMVCRLAGEFFTTTNTPWPFDEAVFKEIIRSNWHYHSPSEEVEWFAEMNDEGTWCCDMSPVLQEMWGGQNDGEQCWAGFEYHFDGYGTFRHEPGMQIKDIGAMSPCEPHAMTPHVQVTGTYFSIPFCLRIHLQPLPDSEVKEVFNTLRNEVTKKETT